MEGIDGWRSEACVGKSGGSAEGAMQSMRQMLLSCMGLGHRIVTVTRVWSFAHDRQQFP